MELATRSGVLSSPSRFGSSPISSSSRRISSSNSLFSGVFDIVVFGLPQHELGKLTRRDLRGQYLPEGDDDVLGRRDDVFHERDVEIEVLVVDDVDDLSFDHLLELREIAHVTGLWIDVAVHRDIEGIVVP